MSTISSISSNFFKKTLPNFYVSSSTNALQSYKLPQKEISNTPQFGTQKTFALASSPEVALVHDPNYIPGKSPPEIPTAPPVHSPEVPMEVPRTPNLPDFDPNPPEKPADPLPIGPHPSPEFPGPSDPIPPMPEVPPPPEKPEVVPPHDLNYITSRRSAH